MGFLATLIPGGWKIALLGLLVAAAAGFYWYHTVVVDQRDAALATVEAQRGTISLLEKENERWAKAYEQALQVAQEAQTVQKEASTQIRKLNDVLSRHNLHALALAKPGLIERRINSGTADVFSMFERATRPGASASGSAEGDSAAPSTN